MPIANPTLENIGSEPQIDSRVQVADRSVVDVAVASGGCCCWANEDPSSPRTFCQALCRLWLFGSWTMWRDQTLLANVFKKETVFKKRNRDEGKSKKKTGPIE